MSLRPRVSYKWGVRSAEYCRALIPQGQLHATCYIYQIKLQKGRNFYDYQDLPRTQHFLQPLHQNH